MQDPTIYFPLKNAFCFYLSVCLFLEQRKVYCRAKQGEWAAHTQMPQTQKVHFTYKDPDRLKRKRQGKINHVLSCANS